VRLPKESNEIESYCVWDFEKNKEVVCLDLGSHSSENLNFIVKGVNSAFNYVWSNGKVFDMEYTYPLLHFPTLKYLTNHFEKVGY